jgi:hypothetical protein
MRLWKILGRLKPCILATGVCLLLSPNQLTAQDLGVQDWNVTSDTFDSGGPEFALIYDASQPGGEPPPRRRATINPEPNTSLLALFGLLGLSGLRRRRKDAK